MRGCWDGIVFDGSGNIIGIFATFDAAMFFQHVHFNTLIPFKVEFTFLTLKMIISRVNISEF